MEYTKEQSNIINHINGSMKIVAGAGSGKTTTMAHYIHNQIKNNKIKEDEILFISFTRFAAKEIKEKIHKVMGSHHKIFTGTFHKTMFKLLKTANLEKPESKKLFDARMQEGVNFFLEKMEEKNKSLVDVLKKYKILAVDEFQDLDYDQFRFITYFKQIVPSLIVVGIGDLAQNIYRFRGTSNEFLRTRLQEEVDKNLKTFTLTHNFRSNKAILNLVNAMFNEEIKEGHILPMKAPSNAVVGMKPKYFEYARNPGKGYGEYEDLVARTLIPIIKKGKENNKSIVLLFPIIKCASFQMVTSLLKEYAKVENLTIDFHQIAKEDETCSTVEFNYDTRAADSPIQLSTFHSSKGLEWDIVAIINIDDSIYDLRETDEDCEAHYAEKTNLTYVGFTRAIEELYLFCNANSGRHRNLANLEHLLDNVMDVTLWGEDEMEDRCSSVKPIGVRDLLRKLPQYPDLFEKICECSENIKSRAYDGLPMKRLDIYSEMKKRNRELAFGTFIDWKIKNMLCYSDCSSAQDYLLTLLILMERLNLFTSLCHLEDAIEIAKTKIEVTFTSFDYNIYCPIEQFVSAARDISKYIKRKRMLVDTLAYINNRTQKLILNSYKKEEKTIEDEYIISQSRDFFVRGVVSEIDAIVSANNSYQGMPDNYEEFVYENTTHLKENIIESLNHLNIHDHELNGDIYLETHSLIRGEVDLYSKENDGLIIELKCGDKTKGVDLRDSGDCKNLLQLLTYVAMGRHGTIPLKASKAMLLNPLTMAREIYDLESWSFDESKKFMECLEELRKRVG
jgi:superfamily I DNA/RNA helicase